MNKEQMKRTTMKRTMGRMNKQLTQMKNMSNQTELIPPAQCKEPDRHPKIGSVQGTNLRRSTRQVVTPRKLHDYYCDDDIEEEMLMLVKENEPASFEEAKNNKEWIRAMQAQIESIEKNKTWALVNRPPEVKPVGVKWVFKVKKNPDGSINIYKARLVAKGFVHKYGVDYEEVFAPVA
ncbi:hypothetical protein E3N88_24970 [Mikania micrantha]|uniref:Reverse transcriptase Ty1/copia-type domain-containing protein n=1 Tax=Mikania micrantha TaxID=192012 RepID=A0A5N6N4C3_9ASTR|nr:hypothetical protein E3N88_24970 [Mikania micrantha]